MTKEFFAEYLKKDNRRRRELLYVMNPIKFMTCQFLIEYHEQHRKDKVIVFSDNIFALREYALKLRRPFIYGATAHNERTRILHHFKHSSEINTIFISRVGDNSIDIPEANVIIQIASHAGARRQEAQRLGRILRPKQSMGVAGSGKTEEFNAFFYSLVSKDTQEMFYSTKRQQFLIDQGYAFKVVTGLLDDKNQVNRDRLCYSKREDQIDLLSRILTVGEADQGDEVLATDKEDALQPHQKLAIAKRSVSSLAGLSGARGMTYMEYQTGSGGGVSSSATGGQKTKKKSDPYKERHFMFRFRKRFQK
jgi:DNA excision repair protein ERCC-3